MAHLGQNIAKLRGLRRLTQKEIADRLKMTQQDYSKIEQKEAIDDDLLELIANVFEVTPDVIKLLDDKAIVNNIQNTFNDNSIQNQFNPIDKIIELYERLLRERDEIIQSLRDKQNP